MAKKPKPQRTYEDWDFDELVNHCAEQIITALMTGNFRGSVYGAIELTVRWHSAQERKRKKNG